jgi:hypothetical protein
LNEHGSIPPLFLPRREHRQAIAAEQDFRAETGKYRLAISRYSKYLARPPSGLNLIRFNITTAVSSCSARKASNTSGENETISYSSVGTPVMGATTHR